MQIRGKLEDRSPADLLEWMQHETKSGVLRFWRTPPGAREPVRKDFWFEKGELVASGTNEPREYLGSFLIAQGKISERDFVRAYRAQLETKVLFGKVLTTFGLLTEREVEVALKEKSEESLWDVFLWRHGKFEFADQVALAGARLPLKVDLAAVIREGERRVIEWGVVRQTLPHLDVEVEVVDPSADSPTDRKILQALSQRRPAAEVAMEMRQSEFLFLRRLAELIRRGKVKLIAIEEHEATPLDPDEVLPVPRPPEPAPDPVRFATGVPGETLDEGSFRTRIPVLKTNREQLVRQRFTPEEGYLISRIDGVFDVATVASLCPFREPVAMAALSDLAQRGILTLQKG